MSTEKLGRKERVSLTTKVDKTASIILGVRKLFTIVFVFSFIIYFISSPGQTPYDYFTRLADSFLHGRYWLTENPPWLNELIQGGQNKFFLVYPPMPAILATPLVFLLGKMFQQQYLAHILGAGIVSLTFLISLKIKKDIKMAIWSAALIGFGGIVWFLSSVGSVWYLGQIPAAFFLTFCLYESLTKKRPAVAGILLGAAFLSRLHTIAALPLVIYLLGLSLTGKLKSKKIVIFFGSVGLFVMAYIYYNFLRFGSLIQTGYSLIPGVLNEPWYQKGIFDLSYISRHLEIIFAAFPKIANEWPYIIPSWRGLAIWITTPAFIYALRAPVKERVVQLSWLTILAIALVVFSHGTTGFAQFGYRFAVDFYPILTFLTIKGVAKTGLKWHHWLLLILGIIVNLWGIIWINKFGWVSF